MKKYLDIKGSGVIDTRGNLKGEILDLIIDVRSRKVCSYILATKGVLSPPAVINLGDIISYGDFIVYGGGVHRVKRGVLHRNTGVQARYYIGRELIDSSGKVGGNLIDFIFDEKSGFIKALICSRGFFEDIFDGRRLIMVNDKTLLERERIIVEESNMEMINNASFNKLLE